MMKFVDFTKTQKSRYLKNETFFIQIKKFINSKHFRAYAVPKK